MEAICKEQTFRDPTPRLSTSSLATTAVLKNLDHSTHKMNQSMKNNHQSKLLRLLVHSSINVLVLDPFYHNGVASIQLYTRPIVFSYP